MADFTVKLLFLKWFITVVCKKDLSSVLPGFISWLSLCLAALVENNNQKCVSQFFFPTDRPTENHSNRKTIKNMSFNFFFNRPTGNHSNRKKKKFDSIFFFYFFFQPTDCIKKAREKSAIHKINRVWPKYQRKSTMAIWLDMMARIT